MKKSINRRDRDFKRTASQNILNDFINGRNNLLYKILLSVDNQISTGRQPKERHIL